MDGLVANESKPVAGGFTSVPSKIQLLQTVFGFLQAANIALWIFVQMSSRFGILRGVQDFYIRPHPHAELPYLCAFVSFVVLWCASNRLKFIRKWLSLIILVMFLQAIAMPG